LKALDIGARVGHDAALQITYKVHLTDGKLDIDFKSLKNNTNISAIEVVSSDFTAPVFAYRINSGSDDYIDSYDNIWAADRQYTAGGYGYVGGNIYSTPHPIANTNDDPLYQSSRWGLTAYRFDVPNGFYAVRLLFAEIYFGGGNSRLFSVSIEDVPILKSMDIGATVGHDAALQIAYETYITDGRLDIEFINKKNNAKISAIEVINHDLVLPEHWRFNPTSNNATVVLPTNINPNVNGTSLTYNDYVGVFTPSGLCCGYGQWQGQNLALTAWGDDDQTSEIDGFQVGEVLNYRVYRIGEQKELTSITLAYSQGDGLYSVNGYMVLNQFDVADINKTITLNFNQGWNCFSINVIPDIADIDSVMKPIVDKILIVKDDNGRVYIPQYNINQIGKIDFKEGYQACLKQAVSLNVTGQAVDPSTPIELPAGWSLISYLPDIPMDIDSALASIIEHLIIAKDCNGNSYIPYYNIDQIDKMYPGQGYWVCLSAPDTLVYPSDDSSVENMFVEKFECKCLNKTLTEHFQFTSGTGENATVVITTDTNPSYSDGAALENGDEIGVFTTNGLCCGAVVWEGVNTAIPLWADNSQTDSLDGFRTGDTLFYHVWKKNADVEYLASVSYREGNPVVYQANGISVLTNLVADLSRQYTSVTMNRRDRPGSFALMQNYPNPFNPVTEIQFEIPKNSFVLLKIYNVLGQEIKTLMNEKKTAGIYRISWDGRDRYGQLVKSGVYFYHLKSENFSQIRKMIYVR